MKEIFKLNSSPNERVEIIGKWQGNVCALSLVNGTDKDYILEDVSLFTAENPFTPDTKFYGEGYNMLSQYGGTIEDFKLTGSFSDYGHYKFKKPDNMNQVYNMAIFYPEGQKPLLIGFSSCNRFNGWIRFNREKIEIALNGEGIAVPPGETVTLEEIYIEQAEYNTALKNFAEAINKNHPMREFPEIPTGWCSWLVYGPNITSKNIYDNLDAIKENGLDLKYIQIDDGYQEYWGDWFNFTDKFEGGVKKVCLDIKEKGFEPAIWVAPFVAEKSSRLFKNHPDWFVKDEQGLPLSSGDVSFGGWRCAPWYILDLTNPEALDYVKTVFSVMRNEWQIKYFKLDAIIWAAMPFGVRYDRTKTAVEAYKIGMQAICDAVGEESFILGGNSPMWPSIGYINGMRVTNDNCRSWYQFKQIARECFPRNWQHNRLWINDPDTVLLQNEMIKVVGPDGKAAYEEGKLSADEFAFNAAYTVASGGMVLSGDDVSKLKPENIELLRRLLPPSKYAAEFENGNYSLGTAVLSETKTAYYIFNFEDEPMDIEIPLRGRVMAYDTIEDKELGVFENKIIMNGIRPHLGKILICEKQG